MTIMTRCRSTWSRYRLGTLALIIVVTVAIYTYFPSNKTRIQSSGRHTFRNRVRNFAERDRFTSQPMALTPSVPELMTDFIPRVLRSPFPTLYPIFDKCSSADDICQLLYNGSPNANERQQFLDLLYIIDKVSTRMNWTYFMVFGTLLGSWRHHGLILWDYDADIYMDVKNRDELLRVFSGSDYTAKKLIPPDHLIKFHSVFAERLSDGPRHGPIRWPYLDIFFYSGNETHVYDVDPVFRKEYGFIFRRSDIFPLHRRPFENMLLFAPKESLVLLQRTYGTGNKCVGSWNTANCSALKGIIPFVSRRYINNAMEETLKFGDQVIHKKVVDEKEEDVTEEFSLKRRERKS